MSLLDKIKGIFKGQEKPEGKQQTRDQRDGIRKEGVGASGQAAEHSGRERTGEGRGGSRGRRRRPYREHRDDTERHQKTEHDKSLGGEAKSPGPSRKRHHKRGPKPGGDTERPRQEQQQSGAEDGGPIRMEYGRESGPGVRVAERDSSRRPPRPHRRGHERGRKKSSDLGGTTHRIQFPELLDINQESEEFKSNEFKSLGLSDSIVLTLAANRFRVPTDIQRDMIPQAIKGRDILGQAKTGTGKTIAFLMPIFERIDNSRHEVQALIVVPTRELCRQVAWEAERFGRSLDAKVLNLYGGTSVHRDIEQLQQGPHIIVGTPGRLLDHMNSGKLQLGGLKALVLDEADRMFDIGFRPDIIKIIKACPENRQIMLLSATLDAEVEELSRRYMHDPSRHFVSKDEITVESIWQRVISTPRNKKIEKLLALLQKEKPTQSIIFTNTKRMSDSLALRLDKLGFKAHCIHSDLTQNKRERIMDEFRTGKIEHLVATDVAARGLDITGISHVVNYDIPANPEDYIHRVGRTGRMGAAGKAFTFVTPDEGKELTQVEKLIDKLLAEYDFDRN